MESVNFQLNIPTDELAEIDSAIAESGMQSRDQYLSYAVASLKWMMKRSREGRSIVALNAGQNTYTELSMPPLEAVKLKAAKK